MRINYKQEGNSNKYYLKKLLQFRRVRVIEDRKLKQVLKARAESKRG